MSSESLGETWGSRVTDDIYILVHDGLVQFSLVRKQHNSADEIARIDDLDHLLSEDCLHMMCDGQMGEFLGCQWDGEWGSVPPGMYIISPELFGFEFDQRIFDPNCRQDVFLTDCGMIVAPADQRQPLPALANFPRLWELFGFLLPKTTRDRVFEPAYNDLLAQHLKAREPRFDTPGQIRWLNFCFFVRSLCLVCGCYRCLIGGTVAAAAMRFLPADLRTFVTSLFR